MIIAAWCCFRLSCAAGTDQLGDFEEAAEHVDAFLAGTSKDTGVDGAFAAARAIHRGDDRITAAIPSP